MKPEPLPKMRRREGVTERITTATLYRTTPRVRPTHVTSRPASLAAGAARARFWMESLVAGSHRYVVAVNARKDPIGRGMLGRNWPRAQEVSLTSCGADDDQPSSSVSITALLASSSGCRLRVRGNKSVDLCRADPPTRGNRPSSKAADNLEPPNGLILGKRLPRQCARH